MVSQTTYLVQMQSVSILQYSEYAKRYQIQPENSEASRE